MRQITLFPANKLGASIAPIYNGHKAIVCHNTDRLIDGMYATAEMMAFKHNVQCTSFLHAFYNLTSPPENGANYGEVLKAVHATGRISFGLYFRTDYWINPRTGERETIPDHNATKWTSLGKSYFPNVVVGADKPRLYPNHGHQLYIESNGEFGYNTETQTMGSSNLSETRLLAEMQFRIFEDLAGLKITSGSYANGSQSGWNVLIPQFFGIRNSSYGFSGNNGNIKYFGMTREETMRQASTCRGWDAVNAGQIVDQPAALNYSASEIDRAIIAGGLYSEFMHWHSVYKAQDTAFFDPFFQMIDTAINGRDVWRAGNNEANEYFVLSQSVNKIGSFVHDNRAHVFIRFKDIWTGTSTNGISNVIDPSRISTPISIEIDLTGTSLAGKNLKSKQATVLRSLGSNKWIINVSPRNTFKNGYMVFSVEEAANTEQYYSAARPTIQRSGNIITADMKSNFVIWRKPINSDDSLVEAIFRTSEMSTETSYAFDTANYNYAVGAISLSRNSSLLRF